MLSPFGCNCFLAMALLQAFIGAISLSLYENLDLQGCGQLIQLLQEGYYIGVPFQIVYKGSFTGSQIVTQLLYTYSHIAQVILNPLDIVYKTIQKYIRRKITTKMYTSQTRKLPRHFTPSQTFYCELAQTQAKTLAFLMPKGCYLVQQSKSKSKHLPPKPKQQINPYSPAAFQTSIPKPHLSHQKQTSQPKQAPKPQHPAKKPQKQQIPQFVKPMLVILQQLKTHKNSWPFLEPVDAQNLGIPEYYEIVKQPMDLSKIEQKLKTVKYPSPQQFYRDVNLMIKNSYLFNAANDDFLKLTNEFERYFWRIAGPESKPVNDKKLEKEKEKERERLQKERLKEEKIREKMMEKEKEKERKLLIQQQQQAELALKLAKKKKKFIPKDMLEAQNISTQQKQQLASNIHALSKQHLKGIRQIVFTSDPRHQQGSVAMVQRPSNINEFDIQKIGFKKIRELQKYVRAKLSQMENTKCTDEMVEKKNEVDLDAMESEWTEEFVE